MAREPLMSLDEKLDPNWTALVCIDYQNDFCAAGGSLDRCGLDVAPMAAIAPSLGRLVDEARDAGVPIIFVRNSYTTKQGWYLSDVSYAQSQRTLQGLNHDIPHCEAGTWGWDYHGDVRPRDDDCEIIKHRYDAFIDTDLDLVLRSRGIRTLIVCGVTTNVCVESTTRHAFFLDYYCVVPGDCVAAYGDGSHEMALRNIDFLFGEVADGDRIIASLSARAGAPRAQAV